MPRCDKNPAHMCKKRAPPPCPPEGRQAQQRRTDRRCPNNVRGTDPPRVALLKNSGGFWRDAVGFDAKTIQLSVSLLFQAVHHSAIDIVHDSSVKAHARQAGRRGFGGPVPPFWETQPSFRTTPADLLHPRDSKRTLEPSSGSLLSRFNLLFLRGLGSMFLA